MHELLTSRRFVPLLVTQLLGVFNDYMMRMALLVWVCQRVQAPSWPHESGVILAGVTLYTVSWVLASLPLGLVFDRFSKATCLRLAKLAELVLVALAAAALVWASIAGVVIVLLMMGALSGAVRIGRYAILPDLLPPQSLMAANSLTEAGIFVMILAALVTGTQPGLTNSDPSGLMWIMGMVALLGCGASWFIPATPAASPNLPISVRRLGPMLDALRNRSAFLSSLGLAWFWLVAAVFLLELGPFAVEAVGGGVELAWLFLALFFIGAGGGALLCLRLPRGETSAYYVPLAAVGMAVFAFNLGSVARHMSAPAEGAVVTVGDFLQTLTGINIVLDLVLLAGSAAVFAVPLYVYLETRPVPGTQGRAMAGNNVMTGGFLVAGLVTIAALFALGQSLGEVFWAMGLVSALVALTVCRLLPNELFRSVAAWVFRQLYGVEVFGLEKLLAVDGPIVIVANHVSWLDGPLLAAFIPGDTAFAINTFIFHTWWGGVTSAFAHMIPIDPNNPMSTKTMIRAVRDGKRLIIFPEGRLTVTGALMKVYDGPAVIADMAGATLVPVKLEGTQFSTLNRLKGKMPQRYFPKITIHVQDPVRLDLPEGLVGRKRRAMAGEALYDVMSRMMFQSRRTDITLFDALLEIRRIQGGERGIVEDVETLERPVSYDRVVFGSLVLGRTFAKLSYPGEYVAMLLPNTVAAVVTFFALQATARVPAMLNFSAGTANILSACATARVRTVITSRRFIEMGRFEDLMRELEKVARIVYLEDVRASAGVGARSLQSLMALPLLGHRLTHAITGLALTVRRLRHKGGSDANTPAVVLFTSGSEGRPKGVALSHHNLLANIAQLGARIDFGPADTLFNALPVFHSFGLTGGLLLPILSGVRTVLYPSPLRYKIIPEVVYSVDATIMFGTNTFLLGYARHANPYSFYSLRYIFAGAEKVEDETRRIYAEKFGLRLFEGYGVTETAPVIAVNTPMYYRAGTVGRVLPGIDVRLEPVPGIEMGQRLFVRGPNIMLGYLRSDAPGVIEPPEGGWYDTGDIVALEPDGFLRILGRAKRFVKIAGEMVSLAAVEATAGALWPGFVHAAVGIPDARKGEQIVLASTCPEASRPAYVSYARSHGSSELMVPRTILCLATIPLMGTGKVDYPALKTVMEQAVFSSLPEAVATGKAKS